MVSITANALARIREVRQLCVSMNFWRWSIFNVTSFHLITVSRFITLFQQMFPNVEQMNAGAWDIRTRVMTDGESIQ